MIAITTATTTKGRPQRTSTATIATRITRRASAARADLISSSKATATKAIRAAAKRVSRKVASRRQSKKSSANRAGPISSSRATAKTIKVLADGARRRTLVVRADQIGSSRTTATIPIKAAAVRASRRTSARQVVPEVQAESTSSSKATATIPIKAAVAKARKRALASPVDLVALISSSKATARISTKAAKAGRTLARLGAQEVLEAPAASNN